MVEALKSHGKASFAGNFDEEFALGELIWTGIPPLRHALLGGYSRIYRAVHRKSHHSVAVKIIKREHFEPDKATSERVTAALNALCALDHPNVIQTFDVYRTEEDYYVVMEYLSGKGLLEHIRSLPSLTEKVVAGLMKDILSGVSYAHKHNVVHGRLNFSMVVHTGSTLKVCGFAGTEALIDADPPKQSDIIFCSPERAAKAETSVYASDVWACGIICSALLSGLIPFTVKDYIQDTLEEIKKCTVSMDTLKEGPWKKVSVEAKKFLLRMLEKNTEKRSSAGALLYDKWLTSATETIVSVEDLRGFCKRMLIAKGASALQDSMLYYLAEKAKASMMHTKAMPMFKEINKSGTGRVTKPEFISVLEKLGFPNAKTESDAVFAKLDLDGSGTLEYLELMAAFFGKDLVKPEENLRVAFESLDVDKSGDLDAEEISRALKGSGSAVTLQQIVGELSNYKGKKMSYADFVSLMRKLN